MLMFILFLSSMSLVSAGPLHEHKRQAEVPGTVVSDTVAVTEDDIAVEYAAEDPSKAMGTEPIEPFIDDPVTKPLVSDTTDSTQSTYGTARTTYGTARTTYSTEPTLSTEPTDRTTVPIFDPVSMLVVLDVEEGETEVPESTDSNEPTYKTLPFIDTVTNPMAVSDPKPV